MVLESVILKSCVSTSIMWLLSVMQLKEASGVGQKYGCGSDWLCLSWMHWLNNIKLMLMI